MTHWIVFMLMTAVAIMAVLWPLARNKQAVPSGTDVAVYRDQLDEIERDRAAGTIGETEAEAARVEVSRRLIGAVDVDPAATTGDSSGQPLWRRRFAAAIALIVLPLGAAALYLTLGSPHLPGQPLATRIAQAHGDNAEIIKLISKVEAHLKQNPNDGRGWEVIAPVYARLGRFDAAIRARRNALRLLGATAERETFLGEALMGAANGTITAEAKAAFDRAYKLDANNVAARYYRGLAAAQGGRRDEAIKIWREMLASAPAGAPWIPEVKQVLARVEGGPAPSAPPSAQLPPIKQTGMIRGMAERLAARLKKDGSDADGWRRLVNSYLVLGERDKAQAAAEDAHKALKADAAKMAPIEALLKKPPKAMTASPATPAPTTPPAPAQTAAAVPKPPHESADQAGSMVKRLAEKLKKDGNNPQGWNMLVRSYLVMGDRAKAKAAVEDARKALNNDVAKMAPLEALLSKGIAATPAPSLPAASNQSAAAKAAPPHQSGDQIKGMVERLAEKLKKDGNNPQGWEMLVRSYMVMGDRAKAKAAVEDARKALNNNAAIMAALEALLKKEFKAAQAPAAPAAPPAPTAPATPPAAATTSPATTTPPASAVGPSTPAPSAKDMAAAAQLAPAQRNEMVRGMVARLAARLKANGSDVNGWLRLVRSYVVLGERDKALAAAADARRALSGDADKLRQLEELVKGLGLAS